MNAAEAAHELEQFLHQFTALAELEQRGGLGRIEADARAHLEELTAQVDEARGKLQELKDEATGLRAKNQAATGAGDAEAERIVQEARREAAAILIDARERANSMKAEAKKQVAALQVEIEAIVARHGELLEQLADTRPADATIN
jgi:cell division septum initiation protein DivIVA